MDELFGQIEAELKSCSEEVRGALNRLEGNKYDSNTNQLSKISGLSREVDALINSQKSMQSELQNIDQNISDIKFMKTDPFSKKSFGSDLSIDPRIKRLEEEIESLAKLINSAKLHSSSLGGTVGYDSTMSTIDRYKTDSLLQTQDPKPSGSFNRNISPLIDDVLHHSKNSDSQYQSWKAGTGNSPSRDKVSLFLINQYFVKKTYQSNAVWNRT